MARDKNIAHIATVNQGTAACGDIDSFIGFLFDAASERIYAYHQGECENWQKSYAGDMSPVQLKELVDNSSYHEIQKYVELFCDK